MRTVTVVGAHGRTGSLVVSELVRAGYDVTGTVRQHEHADDLTRIGARGVVLDLMDASRPAMKSAVKSADAVVYAAGSGRGDPRHVVEQLDRDAIVRAADAAISAGADRFVLVSAHRTDEDSGDDTVVTLLRAKRAADAHVRSTPLDWTIIRPDALTDLPPTGLIRIGATVPRGPLSRSDLAATIVAVLASPSTSGHQFEMTGGNTVIADALRAL